jgi:tetratricopeptide (TPR) repeat protein
LPLDEALEARRRGAPPLPADALVPPAMRRVVERLLAPSPELRPPGALAAVRLLNAETGRSLPAEPDRLAARPGLAPLVGRAEALERVEGRLASSEAARVLLTGATGSGRSRLLEEIGVRARLAGRPVHRQAREDVEAEAVVLLDEEARRADVRAARGLVFETAGEEASDQAASETIRLGPLSAGECLELAAGLLGLAPFDGGDGAALLAASGGLPGPLEQLVAALAESGGLRVEGDRLLVDAEKAGARPDVAALLRERTARLSADAAVLLDLAALFRDPVTPALLAALANVEADDAQHQAALAELREAGLLVAMDDEPDGPHLLVPSPARSAVLEALPPTRRRLLHFGAAAALSRHLPVSEGEQAWHLEEAGATERAAPLHLAAGRARLAGGLPRDAAAHLRRALELGAAGDGEPGARLRLELARAEALLGDAATAVRRVEEALPLLPDDGARADALAFAAETASHAGDPDAAEAACRRARRAFRRAGSRVGRAECTSRLALVALERGDLRRARAGFRAALAVARQEGEADLEARALNNLGSLARQCGELDEAARCHDEAHRLRARSGDRQGAAKALNNRGIVLGMAGRLEEASESLAAAVDGFREVGDRREEARALNNRGMVLWLSGRLPEAAEAFSRAAGLFKALEDAGLHADALRNEGLVALDRGEPGTAATLLEQALASAEPASRQADVALDLGDALRALGRLSEAAVAHRRAAEGASGPEAELGRVAATLDEALAGAQPIGAAKEPADLARWPEDLERRWRIEAGRLAELVGLADVALSHGRRARDLGGAGVGAHERLWAAALAAGAQPEGEELAALQDALAAVPAGQVPGVAWRVRLRLARAFRRDGRRLMAAAQAESARELLEAPARGLDAEGREAYWSVPERAAARAELDGLAVAPGAPAATTPDADVAPTLLELVRLLNAQLDVEALLPRVVDFAIELTGADRGCLILFDAEPEGVRVARGRDGTDLPRERFRHSQTIVQQVRTTGRPVVVESFADGNEDEEALRSASVHELRLGSATCVPLPEPAGVAGGPLGALYVDSLTRRSGFAQREVDTLAAMAAHAATALVNAQLLERARAERASLASEVERLRGAGAEGGFGGVLGRSPAMREVFTLLERVAPSEASVLIEGESGTGKELAARAVHERSRRADRHAAGGPGGERAVRPPPRCVHRSGPRSAGPLRAG